MPDDVNRDNMYTDEWDDEGPDYELEPPDAEVLAAEQRRADETVAAVQQSIDVDEIYREFEDRQDSEILRRWVRNFRPRFQVRDMLIATAVVAILLTLWRFDLLMGFVVWVVLLGVVGVTLYLQWKEHQRQAAADERRRQKYAERRAQLQSRPAAARPATIEPAKPPAAGPSLDEFDEVRQRAAAKTFEFKFSLRQLLIAITAAAVLLGLINLLGGPQNAATLLGFVALAGLVAHALGYEPPGIVAFGWWVLLLLYIAVSVMAAVWAA
jgi:hypothetical protein